MPFLSISDAQQESFVSALRAGRYSLLLGAGASVDSMNDFGNLPTSRGLAAELCDYKCIKGEYPLHKIYALLSDQEKEKLVTERLKYCTPGPTYKYLREFLWKRIYTFNIDDALFESYFEDSKQTTHTIHFSDSFSETTNLSELQIVYLHGFVRSEKGYVFSRDDYIKHIKSVNPWMVVLSQQLSTDSFVLVGTSLDDVDLDYYLSFRSTDTVRMDRGPSILVEPKFDEIILNECLSKGLLPFIGTAEEFFTLCDKLLPHKATPQEILPKEARNIFPIEVSEKDRLTFFSDFSLVPSSGPPSSIPPVFLYGHPPTWGDLADNLDVSRSVTSSILNQIESLLSNGGSNVRLLLLSEAPGSGKTTVLRRCAFELSQRGIRSLLCSALGRLDPVMSARLLDSIKGPIAIFVDDFAEQAAPVSDIMELTTKRDLIWVAAERNYRYKYIKNIIPAADYRTIGSLRLSREEITQTVKLFTRFGIVAEGSAFSNVDDFIQSSRNDPISAVCCRILNDFRPIDIIVDEILENTTPIELLTYTIAAICQYCFRGGVRYDVLSTASSWANLKKHFSFSHPLPLAFFDDNASSYVVPLSTTLAERVLVSKVRTDPALVLDAFVSTAKAIAPRVSRSAIMQRSPEARLAGRLFDYDAVVKQFLGDSAIIFYQDVQEYWQWNSRYWEQVALIHLARARQPKDRGDQLEEVEIAVQHAQHAVSIEFHSHSLTTLGTIYFEAMKIDHASREYYCQEATEKLYAAIHFENRRDRKTIHPYVALFRGLISYLSHNGRLRNDLHLSLLEHLQNAEDDFPRDTQLKTLIAKLRDRL